MADHTAFLDVIKSRRTVYSLNKDIPISNERLGQIVRTVIESTPTAFNHQGTRIIAFTGKEHDKLWDIVKDVMKVQLGDERYQSTEMEKKLQQFQDAYGTALFFEDPVPKRDFQGKFKRYADHFDEWQHHGSGMAQYVLWTSLWAEGCGCNLQHFNPVIDSRVKHAWNIEDDWRLTAQLVFGGKKEGWKENLREKMDYYEVGERYQIFS